MILFSLKSQTQLFFLQRKEVYKMEMTAVSASTKKPQEKHEAFSYCEACPLLTNVTQVVQTCSVEKWSMIV